MQILGDNCGRHRKKGTVTGKKGQLTGKKGEFSLAHNARAREKQEKTS